MTPEQSVNVGVDVTLGVDARVVVDADEPDVLGFALAASRVGVGEVEADADDDVVALVDVRLDEPARSRPAPVGTTTDGVFAPISLAPSTAPL